MKQNYVYHLFQAQNYQSEFYKRLKNIKVPYDMGRLPNNINSSEGLSGLTAQQWKNFACIYA